MKSLLWLSIFALIPLKAHAESYHSPLLCDVDDLILHVNNNTPETQEFWFQDLGAVPFQEAHIPLKAQGRLSLPLDEHLPARATALALKTHSQGLEFRLFCKSQQLEWQLDHKPSPWKKLTVPAPHSDVLLALTNLSQQANPVEVFVKAPLGGWRKIHSLILAEDFSTTMVPMNLPSGVRSLKIRAQGRWSGLGVASGKKELLPLEAEKVFQAEPLPAQVRYFLFESQNPNPSAGSFVVPMTNAALIEESLQQLKNPSHQRLLVARIEKSLQGINRNFASPLHLPWSWQVAEAQNYADFAHISCDGNPTLVEERLNAWMQETGGTICFWNYRIAREIHPWEFSGSPGWWPPAPPFLPRTH